MPYMPRFPKAQHPWQLNCSQPITSLVGTEEMTFKLVKALFSMHFGEEMERKVVEEEEGFFLVWYAFVNGKERI